MSITAKKLAEYQKKFGARVRELRIEKGMSQLDLAVACGFEKTTISRIETGRTNVTLKTLLTLCDSLEVTLKEVFV